MLAMLEFWRAFFGITDGDGAEATRAKVAGRLLPMDESFREVLPLLFDVFGVPDPTNPAPAIDPEQRQKRLHGLVKRVLQDPGYSAERVLLLEDLHWFDGASDAFLETAVESVPATRGSVARKLPSGIDPCQPRLWPSFSSRGLQAAAKFVQTSPSLQTPATSPVSPLKWTQDESTFPHAMSPTATSKRSIFIAIETERYTSARDPRVHRGTSGKRPPWDWALNDRHPFGSAGKARLARRLPLVDEDKRGLDSNG
jgi:hypothetical protein